MSSLPIDTRRRDVPPGARSNGHLDLQDSGRLANSWRWTADFIHLPDFHLAQHSA